MTLLLPFLVAAATFAVASLALGRRGAAVDPGSRVSAYVAPRRVTLPREDEEVLVTRFQRPLAASERALRGLPGWERLEALVERADLRLRPVELVYVTLCGLLVVGLLGLAMGLPLAAVVLLALVALVGLRGYLALRVTRRRRAFEEQLPELLQSLGSALRAGHGFNQALQAVAADTPEPAAKELRRVLAETRLGRPLEDALTDVGARLGSQEFDFVLRAIVVQRQVGGSLAGIFEIVEETVRGRQRFVLRLRSLTATGRMSALVLMALPPGLALLLSLMNHGYLAPLLGSGIGRLLLVLSGFLFVVGAIWLRRIVSYKG